MMPPTTTGTADELPPSLYVQLDASVATFAAVISVKGE
jgi:hypothetical protein